MSGLISVIFVPQGAEFKAVQRGLKRSAVSHVALCAVPMGPSAVQRYVQTELKTWTQPPCVLLMGLCGSLTPDLDVGDWVLYRSCLDGQQPEPVPQLDCDAVLLKTLQEHLGKSVTVVTSVMCDRMIHRAADKRALAAQSGAAVVDMEGYAVLKAFQGTEVAVSMLRVVSDAAQQDVPDLSAAMTANGTLNPWALAACMMQAPRPAWRLIQGSLTGLKQLEAATVRLFGPA
jgi:nucleoside phosphorylase